MIKLSKNKKIIISISTLTVILLISVGFLYLYQYDDDINLIIIDECGYSITNISDIQARGIIWAQYNEYVIQPTLDAEMADTGNLYAPDILIEDEIYKMWYGAQDINGHDSILYATSDNGRNWIKYGTVIPTGKNNHVNDPSVIKVNEIYWMFYTVAPEAELDEIWAAQSKNGIDWVNNSCVLKPSPNQGDFDSLKVGRPTVLYQNNTFKMWFDGSQRDPNNPKERLKGSGRHIGFANSTDGFNFTKYTMNPIFLNSGAIDIEYFNTTHTFVVVEESQYGVKWRTGTSEINFEQIPRFLFYKMNTAFDKEGHVTPFILKETIGNLEMWTATYTGAATEGWNHNRIAVWYPFYNISLYSEKYSISYRPWAYSRFCLKWEIIENSYYGTNLELVYFDGGTLLSKLKFKIDKNTAVENQLSPIYTFIFLSETIEMVNCN